MNKITETTRLSRKLKTLENVLGDLVDIQNGPPLIRDTKKWKQIMSRAYKLLER